MFVESRSLAGCCFYRAILAEYLCFASPKWAIAFMLPDMAGAGAQGLYPLCSQEFRSSSVYLEKAKSGKIGNACASQRRNRLA